LRRITRLSRTFTSASTTALQTGQTDFVYSRKTSSRSTFTVRPSTTPISFAPFPYPAKHVLDHRTVTPMFRVAERPKRLDDPCQRGKRRSAAPAAGEVAADAQAAQPAQLAFEPVRQRIRGCRAARLQQTHPCSDA
jgi:hypothetical protein